jgi:predicted HTH domain antitoxin
MIGSKAMLVNVRDLVDANLYPDEESVVRDALRSLLRTRPEMRLELAVRRYEAEEDLSLARAASIAGVSFDQMKALLHERGIPLRLGPTSVEEAQAEVTELKSWFDESPR